ncbi:MAG TPA: putative quinol monooxygenase [Chloroflexota bacterium]|nr:putative quinol monooxygenase [Chloroflexota bacterium]
MIFITAKFKVRPQYADSFAEVVRDFTEATRREPGNLWFEWSRSVENPNEYVLIEAFRDGQAGLDHVNSDHFKKAIRETPSLLAETPDIVNVEVPGTEWSKLTEMTVPEGSTG